jgi:hypothetical protein
MKWIHFKHNSAGIAIKNPVSSLIVNAGETTSSVSYRRFALLVGRLRTENSGIVTS